jgi:glycosyltransferase involved in cell wall biosynthesis
MDHFSGVGSIIGLLDAPEKAQKIGAMGRAYVQENFSWDQKYAELSELVKNAYNSK